MEELRRRGVIVSVGFANGERLNTITGDFLKDLKRAGCYFMLVGIESGSQRILDAMEKGLNLDLVRERVRLIKKAGLTVHAFFIIGFPGETEEDIQQTMRFARSLPLDGALFSCFLPLPGSEITNDLIACGDLAADFHWGNLFYSRVTYALRGLTPERLKALQRRATLAFYLQPRILFSLPWRIKSWYHFKVLAKKTWDNLFLR